MSCIALVGMPGAGKSTVGVLLAKATAKDFVDTDVLIQVRAHQSLQSIVDRSGFRVLRDMEEAVLMNLDLSDHVIATGGSAIYSGPGMARLKQLGPVVYLRVSLVELERRVGDLPNRGIADDAGKGLADLYRERCALYEQHADLIVDCEGKRPEAMVEAIREGLRGRFSDL